MEFAAELAAFDEKRMKNLQDEEDDKASVKEEIWLTKRQVRKEIKDTIESYCTGDEIFRLWAFRNYRKATNTVIGYDDMESVDVWEEMKKGVKLEIIPYPPGGDYLSDDSLIGEIQISNEAQQFEIRREEIAATNR